MKEMQNIPGNLNTKDLKEYLEKNKDFLYQKYHLKKIGFFGSFARGEQDTGSDVDIIVEFENNTSNLYELKMELRNYLKKELNRDVDIAREKYLKVRIKEKIISEAIFV